jgi:hypothetical protein
MNEFSGNYDRAQMCSPDTLLSRSGISYTTVHVIYPQDTEKYVFMVSRHVGEGQKQGKADDWCKIIAKGRHARTNIDYGSKLISQRLV